MATTYAYGADLLNDRVETLALATTLTAGDSGKTYFLNAAGGKAITLPSPVAGVRYKFVVGALFASTNWVLTAPTAIIQGGCIVNSVNVLCAAKATINVIATADTVGDSFELLSDGTNYYVSGVAALAGAITFI